MTISPTWLLAVAAVSLLVSLALAWIASLIVYTKVAWLAAIFEAPYQLVRAHIDYLLMSLLLVMVHYLTERLGLILPPVILLLLCIGSLYNPLGFIALAIRPQMARPPTRSGQLSILVGFLPATIGYGYAMCAVLRSLATS